MFRHTDGLPFMVRDRTTNGRETVRPSIPQYERTRVTGCAFLRAAGSVTAAIALTADLGALAAAEPQTTQAIEPMKMDESMSGEMKKKGMKKGDVKKAAEKKEREMKGAIEREEKSMPQGATK